MVVWATRFSIFIIVLSLAFCPVVSANDSDHNRKFSAILMADCLRFTDGTSGKQDLIDQLNLVKVNSRKTGDFYDETYVHNAESLSFEIRLIESSASCSVLSTGNRIDEEREYLKMVLEHEMSPFVEVEAPSPSQPKELKRFEMNLYSSESETLSILVSLLEDDAQQMLIATTFRK